MGSRGLWGRVAHVGHAGVPSPPTPPVEVKPEGPHPHLRGGASPQATPPAAPDPKPIPDPDEKEEEEEEEEEGGGSRDPPEALSLWLSDMEELMGRQRPPAADLKVAKAQLDEQKVGAAPRRGAAAVGGALSPGGTPTAPRPPQLLRRLLEERRPRVERCLRERSGGGEALRRRWGRLREEADERYERGAARRGAADAVTRGHRRGGGGTARGNNPSASLFPSPHPRPHC